MAIAIPSRPRNDSDAPARPSEFDREHAWPWYSYIIVSVLKGTPADTTSWRLHDDRAAYDPEAIETVAHSAHGS